MKQRELFTKRGPGRPRKRGEKSRQHKPRPEFEARHPVHVTLRVTRAIGNLRRRHAYHAIRHAMYPGLARTDFRIIHVSIQHDHVHLIVEADGARALSRGMQGFQISAAQRLNRALAPGRRGQVFVDRYHARVLTSPTRARNALAYVLNNWRKHREDRGRTTRLLDPYSSAINFGGWAELDDSPLLYTPPLGYQRLSTCLPHTWMLQQGWRRAGPISALAAPRD